MVSGSITWFKNLIASIESPHYVICLSQIIFADWVCYIVRWKSLKKIQEYEFLICNGLNFIVSILVYWKVFFLNLMENVCTQYLCRSGEIFC